MKNKNKGLGVIVLVLFIVLTAIIVLLITTKTGKSNDDKILPYTDLIKQVSSLNIAKIEMTTGSTTVKVTLKKEIDKEGKIVKDGLEYKKEEK